MSELPMESAKGETASPELRARARDILETMAQRGHPEAIAALVSLKAREAPKDPAFDPLAMVRAKIGMIMERQPRRRERREVSACLWGLPLECVPHRGGVYMIQQGVDGAIKIGFSKASVRQRMETLQAGSPIDLRLLVIIRGTRSTESEIHRMFSDLRLRHHGPGSEWFRNDPRLIAYAKSQLTCPPQCKHTQPKSVLGRLRTKAERRKERERNPPPISPQKAARIERDREMLREAARQTGGVGCSVGRP